MTAIPIWPTAMRQSGGAGVTGAPQTNVASFTPDIGPSIDRRRATSFTSIYDIDFTMLTREEYDAFKEFFHTTLMDGVLPFAWQHPLTDVLMRAKFYLRDGSAYEETRVKSDRYSIRCRVQFINIIENSAVLALDYEAGIFLDFATGKYSIVNDDFTIETGSIDSILNYSRASVGTYIGSDGLVKTAASGVLRYTYDPSTLAALGFLSEESRANIFTNSEDASGFTLSNLTLSANSTAAPNGATTADKLVEAATTSVHLAYRGLTIIANTVYTASAFVKAGGRDRFSFRWEIGGGTSGVSAAVNLATGTIGAATVIGSGTAVASGIQQLPGGWFRVWVSGKVDASATSGFMVIQLLDASGNTSYLGNVANGLFGWGYQVELGAFPTSYIPTSGSPVTRAADVAYILLSTLPYNAAEVTLLADYRALYADAVNNKIALSVNDNTFDNYMAIGHNVSNFPIAVSVVATATQASLNTGAIVPSNRVRQVAAFKANDFSLYQNASAATPDTSGTVPTVTRLHIGSLSGAYGWVNGPIKQAAMYASRRANAANSALSVAA